MFQTHLQNHAHFICRLRVLLILSHFCIRVFESFDEGFLWRRSRSRVTIHSNSFINAKVLRRLPTETSRVLFVSFIELLLFAKRTLLRGNEIIKYLCMFGPENLKQQNVLVFMNRSRTRSRVKFILTDFSILTCVEFE